MTVRTRTIFLSSRGNICDFADGLLYSVVNVGTTEAWAVGETPASLPVAQHRVGGAWGSNPPDLGDFENVILQTVDALGPTSIWTAGIDGHGSNLMVLYDGADWTYGATPPGEFDTLTSLVMLATNQGYVGGRRRAGGGIDVGEVGVGYWNGESWFAQIASPFLTDPFTTGFLHAVNGVHAYSGSSVWVCGEMYGPDHFTNAGAFAMRWNDGIPDHQMEAITSGQDAATGIFAYADDEAWVIMNMDMPEARKAAGAVQLVPGIGWVLQELPGPYGAEDRTADAIHGTGGGNIWAVGGYRHPVTNVLNPAIWHWNGMMWTALSTPVYTEDTALADVHAYDEDHVWAVGYSYCTPAGHFTQFAMRFNGSYWVEDSPPS